MSQKPLTVREERPFVRWAEENWSREECDAFIDYIARNPLSGVVIPGAGGIRKVRWAGSGRGKRGGARVIYYFYSDEMPLFLITAYAKNVTEDLNELGKASMRKFVANIKLLSRA